MPPLNPEAIERLQKLGGDAFLLKMIDLFLEFGGQKVAEAVAASSSGDFALAGKAAHAIKSSAANLGATHVERIAATIEETVRADDTAGIPDMVRKLQAAFEEVKPLLGAQKQSVASEEQDPN